jgi:hypothetical protein
VGEAVEDSTAADAEVVDVADSTAAVLTVVASTVAAVEAEEMAGEMAALSPTSRLAPETGLARILRAATPTSHGGATATNAIASGRTGAPREPAETPAAAFPGVAEAASAEVAVLTTDRVTAVLAAAAVTADLEEIAEVTRATAEAVAMTTEAVLRAEEAEEALAETETVTTEAGPAPVDQ